MSSLLAENTYVNFLDRIFVAHPELEDQLQIKDVKSTLPSILGIEHTYSELFVSTKSGSGSALHNHSVWNFFLQVDGRKKWTLVDPEFSHLVDPTSHTLEFGTGQRLRTDPADFPLYEFCPRYEVTLNPGDLLFIPPMWWHRIDNQGSGGGEQESIVGVTLKYYDLKKSITSTYSDPRFNRFNEIHCLWRSLFIFGHAKIVRRELVKHAADPSQVECPIQARLWTNVQHKKGIVNRWRKFRDLCLNDPDAHQY